MNSTVHSKGVSVKQLVLTSFSIETFNIVFAEQQRDVISVVRRCLISQVCLKVVSNDRLRLLSSVVFFFF